MEDLLFYFSRDKIKVLHEYNLMKDGIINSRTDILSTFF